MSQETELRVQQLQRHLTVAVFVKKNVSKVQRTADAPAVLFTLPAKATLLSDSASR